MATRLADQIGIRFNDERLLQSALVHRSFIHEHPERAPGLESNERLEFLGDAILNFLTADWLYRRFPERGEGELTSLRAALVRTSTLAEFARSLDLGSLVRISRGEDSPAARNRDALLADLFEALLGAIFLDQGLERARDFVLPYLERQLAAVEQGAVAIDYRTRLQELAQARLGHTPRYETVAVSGPDHQREFTLHVAIGDRVLGVGSGPSKRAAAQAAARVALIALEGPAPLWP